MDRFDRISVVFFDFGDTLGRLRPPFDRLPDFVARPDPGTPHPVTAPGSVRRCLRRLAYPLLARLWRPFPDTVAVLDELRARGYRLAVLSNNSPILVHQLRALGISARFETVTYSEEVGVEKPDPGIFRTALERMQISPAEAAHVGDRFRADALGAKSAGVVPILFDPGGEHAGAGEFRVASLSGLLDLLPAPPRD
jgi:HAD superfamily hydrolase (TIGR01662 family)